MTPMQFVSCSDGTCPFNEMKSCRAPFIAINEEGRCMIRVGGPYENKAPTESYVEIRECRCQKCNNWELDEVMNIGLCGLRADLFFAQYKNEELGPKCNTFDKQIATPGFSAPNV